MTYISRKYFSSPRILSYSVRVRQFHCSGKVIFPQRPFIRLVLIYYLNFTQDTLKSQHFSNPGSQCVPHTTCAWHRGLPHLKLLHLLLHKHPPLTHLSSTTSAICISWTLNSLTPHCNGNEGPSATVWLIGVFLVVVDILGFGYTIVVGRINILLAVVF